jgi:hypothetical protein
MHFTVIQDFLWPEQLSPKADPDNPIVFEGARTESAYRNIPGQWEGIWLMPGSSTTGLCIPG